MSTMLMFVLREFNETTFARSWPSEKFPRIDTVKRWSESLIKLLATSTSWCLTLYPMRNSFWRSSHPKCHKIYHTSLYFVNQLTTRLLYAFLVTNECLYLLILLSYVICIFTGHYVFRSSRWELLHEK